MKKVPARSRDSISIIISLSAPLCATFLPLVMNSSFQCGHSRTQHEAALLPVKMSLAQDSFFRCQVLVCPSMAVSCQQRQTAAYVIPGILPAYHGHHGSIRLDRNSGGMVDEGV